ncbi:MAG: hypothetical protein WCU88_10630 [Elusimicrobiota bacterium]|jgi:hypothetical protein
MATETKTEVDQLLEDILAKGRKEAVPEEETDLDKLSRKSPPSRGLCRRCGENKPINRLMLCYPCWVKTNLEEKGWREGLPHPEGCDCCIGGHGSKSEGN